MLAIKEVYDKGKIESIEEVPIKGRRKVVVTFLDEPIVETDLGLEEIAADETTWNVLGIGKAL